MHISPIWLAFGIIAAPAISLIAWRLGALTLSGTTAAAVVGVIVMSIGGLAFGLPMVVFFVSASAWSRWCRRSSSGQHLARNAWQVMANGGVPAAISLAALLIPASKGPAPRDWFLLYLAATGFACGDTWATEVGSKIAKRAWLIASGRWVPAGQSGGVTVMGSLAAAAGASVVAASGWIVWSFAGLDLQWRMDTAEALAVVWAAFVAVMLDSVLGAAFQAQYRCEICGLIVEDPIHCATPAVRSRGLRWLGNDAVNLFAAAASVGFAWYLLNAFAWPR